MKRRDRKPRNKQETEQRKNYEATRLAALMGSLPRAPYIGIGGEIGKPPPFVRAAIARLGRKHEERLLRDADELHRRQRQPCDVTSRREADEIYRQFLNFV